MYTQFKNSELGKSIPVTLIPNGINLVDYPKKRKTSTSTKIIFYAAMNAIYDKNKGLDLLIKALDKTKKRKNKIILRIAGTHSLENYSIPDWISVECLDNLTPQQMYREYSMADITVVPSRLESFSLITLESMAVGTPVVAFAVGGIVDLIDHKTNGYLVQPYNTNDFAKGIDYLLSSPSRLKVFGNSARLKAKYFDIHRVSRQYQTLYRQILSSINPNSIATQS